MVLATMTTRASMWKYQKHFKKKGSPYYMAPLNKTIIDHITSFRFAILPGDDHQPTSPLLLPKTVVISGIPCKGRI
ncbi:hypothetical protein PEPS_19820 [Persicobacter psychrovividus]|uniref:Uncharacterized protein n=1 Tax=Persicobacter psychrovividus TaxID=387638 RepID=A0ABN6LE70_9BACT|nr:hypothetical protein PEPS_19820 [Persicobacter psychrovividus]